MEYPVKRTMSDKEMAERITNHDCPATKKLPSERVEVAEVDPRWSYNHHAQIAFFKGKFYAVWSSGLKNEDDCFQRVMYCYSEDFYHWSQPMELAGSHRGQFSQTVLATGGFYAGEDKLVTTYIEWEYDPTKLTGENLRPTAEFEYISPPKFYYKTSEDGLNWSDSVEFDFYGGNCTTITPNGRMITAGNEGVSWTDNMSGYEDWHVSMFDKDKVKSAYERGASLLCEGSVYVTDDGIAHDMLRSNTPYLWCCDSYDNGETWGEIHPTKFSDDTSKFEFGRLPDGRFFCVGNGIYTGTGMRPYLTICLSKDGYDFNECYIIRDEEVTMQYRGLYKGGNFGYPRCLIHDGYLYVIYTKVKEVVEITRIKLEDIC